MHNSSLKAPISQSLNSERIAFRVLQGQALHQGLAAQWTTRSTPPQKHMGGQTRSYLAKMRSLSFMGFFAPKTENMVFSAHENWHFSAFWMSPSNSKLRVWDQCPQCQQAKHGKMPNRTDFAHTHSPLSQNMLAILLSLYHSTFQCISSCCS